MIKLILVNPTLNIPLPEADLILAETDQYVAGYARIVSAIHDRKNVHILVTNKLIGKWLGVLPIRYGAENVAIEEINLKGQLSKQIGLVIPESVSDQQIKESGLLDLNIPANSNVSFEEYLLEVFFGSFLISDGALRSVGNMIERFDEDQWKSALQRPYIRDLYLQKLREIRAQLVSERRNGELALLNWLDESPRLLIRNLSALRMLLSYPEEMGVRLFGTTFIEIRDLKLDLKKVPIIIKGNERVLDEIRIFLSSKNDPKSIEQFLSLLDQICGLLEIEFSSVYSILQKGNISVDQPLINLIRSKFTPIKEIPSVSQSLAELDLLITRPQPIQPRPEWTDEDWIHWAVESYLPYRFWLENTGQLNDEIANIAGSYSDWFSTNYGALKYHSKRMAWKWLLTASNQWKQLQSPVVVVMADNLNAKFYPDLLQQLQLQGYYEQEMDYVFSMLPSCTEVSKKCVITGHYQPFKDTSYKNQVESIWTARLQKRVLYVGSIGEFRAIQTREYDIYFLNYLPLDITLHQNENQTGLSHSQAIRNYLSSLSLDIRAFAERVGADRDLTVVIISDHGSTRIPKGAINLIQGEFYRKRADDDHHRYISIPDEEIKKLPENYKYDCYLLNRQVMELETNYLVARRLYRFLPTDENAYIHGGLTPEETIIPAAIYQPVIASAKPLAITITGTNRIYVGTKFDLKLEITNLNNYVCDNCKIEVLDANLETSELNLGNIGKLVRLPVTIPARCSRNGETGSRKLNIRLSFDFLGQPYINNLAVPIEVIEPAKPKFDLDKL